MKWVSSAGGPLILLEQRLLCYWNGCLGQARRTDYDRAAEILGFLDLIPVGDGKGMVLWGEPMQTCWMPANEADGGALVRWMYADSEGDVFRHVQDFDDCPWRSQLSFGVDDSRLVLFDSALAGMNVNMDVAQLVELIPGCYEISTALLEPDSRTSLLVHRLHKLPVP